MEKTLSFIKDQLRGYYPEAEANALAYRLVESVCGLSRHDILLGKDTKISEDMLFRLKQYVAELQQYKPLQYILGETEFYGLRLQVNGQVLIPRPETEELIELILKETSLNKPLILDIGTGSGNIAIALAKSIPNAQVYAMDVSEDALKVASVNAQQNDVSIRFFQGDILGDWHHDGLLPRWDIIVSNPPYITPEEKTIMQPNVLEYEPHQALFVPQNKPLLFYERIAEIGLLHLNPEGALFFETGALYGKDTAEMLKKKGYKEVILYQDISGKDRMIKARL